MTFILNILHKDFAILMADTRSVTIGDNGEHLSIDETHKISLYLDNKIAIGIAGEQSDHDFYQTEIDINATSVAAALSIIDDYINGNFSFRSDANVGSAVFFDAEKQSFCIKYYKYGCTTSPSSTSLEIGNDSINICQFGSGSRCITPAISEHIDSFSAELNEHGLNLQKAKIFAEKLFRYVSLLDEYVGSSFEIFYATKSFQTFSAYL